MVVIAKTIRLSILLGTLWYIFSKKVTQSLNIL